MIRLELGFGLVVLAMWVYSLVDVVQSDEGAIRHLPKVWWLLIVLFFPFAGSVAWLVAGRPQTARSAYGPNNPGATGYPEYDRPGRAVASDPQADEEFLRQVRERAEEQRRLYRERRRAEEEDRE